MQAQDMLQFENWVVVGDVLNETKYAYKIATRLKQEKYNVLQVNPRSKDENIYKSLSEINAQIDAIDLVIHPKIGLDIVKEAKKLGIKNILIQPGAESEEILDFCKKNDINAVQGCILLELCKRG